MFAIVVSSPFISSATYTAAVACAFLTIALYWPQVREQHTLDPHVTRIVLAFLFAAGIATVGALADGAGIYMCTADWITGQCGEGESWCRSYFEWSCWLQGS